MFRKSVFCLMFCVVISSLLLISNANAATYVLQLTMTDQFNDGGPGEGGGGFGKHDEYGQVSMNGQPAGNYRIIGRSYETLSGSVDVKSGDLYLELTAYGNLFITGISSTATPDLLEGIVLGGTGTLQGYRGTATLDTPEFIGDTGTLTLVLTR